MVLGRVLEEILLTQLTQRSTSENLRLAARQFLRADQYVDALLTPAEAFRPGLPEGGWLSDATLRARRNEVSSVELHAVDMEIEKVTVDGAPAGRVTTVSSRRPPRARG